MSNKDKIDVFKRITSYCPCDQCFKFNSCAEGCSNFKEYTNTQLEHKRKEALNSFVATQKIAIRLENRV